MMPTASALACARRGWLDTRRPLSQRLTLHGTRLKCRTLVLMLPLCNVCGLCRPLCVQRQNAGYGGLGIPMVCPDLEAGHGVSVEPRQKRS